MRNNKLIIIIFLAVTTLIYPQQDENNFNTSNVASVDSFYIPLHVGNQSQYLDVYIDQDGASFDLYYSEVYNDTLIGDRIYYKTTFFSDFIRYSKFEKKLFIRWNNFDYVHIDFNVPADSNYQIFDRTHNFRTVSALGGIHNLFNAERIYGGYLYLGAGWGESFEYTDSIGLSNTAQGFSHGTFYKDLIQAIVYDSTGNPIYFTDHYKPTFDITPITVINTSDFILSFKVNHHFTKILQDPPPFNHGLDFIKNVIMYSYYSKDDSVISIPPVTPIHSSTPVNADYLVNTQLDTIIMKNGFVFNYRFFAEDKGIIPEHSSSPDSGYYQCVWDETTDIEDGNNLGFKFLLNQNYPNPFNPSTSIQYTLSSRQFVTIKVYDLLGKEVVTLVNEAKLAGEYVVEFNAAKLPSGIYFYRIQAGDFTETKKMVLIR